MIYCARWIGCWVFYLIGHFISRLHCGWLYTTYNWLMLTSANLDRGDLGIWEYPKEQK